VKGRAQTGQILAGSSVFLRISAILGRSEIEVELGCGISGAALVGLRSGSTDGRAGPLTRWL